MDFNDLTEEQKAKARGCETPEDILELVSREGMDLSDEQLEQVSGGAWTPEPDDDDDCPLKNCGTFC